MITISVYGRLGRDPALRMTKAGNEIVTTSIAVDATAPGADDQATIWLNVIAFGRVADILIKHTKGENLSAVGRMTQATWIRSDGSKQEQMTIVADTIVSARTVRPAGSQKANSKPPANHKPVPSSTEHAGDFDDDIPF